MKVKAAREAVVLEMQKMGLIDHIDDAYTHTIATCYRCGTTIEPMLIPQWYIKTKPLAKPALQTVKEKKIKIFPKNFEKVFFSWLESRGVDRRVHDVAGQTPIALNPSLAKTRNGDDALI